MLKQHLMDDKKQNNVKSQKRKKKFTRKDGPHSWDYALVFEIGEDEDLHEPTKCDKQRKIDEKLDDDPEWNNGMAMPKFYGQIAENIRVRLATAKLKTRMYKTADEKLQVMMVGITESNLRYWAERRETELLIDPKGAVQVGCERKFPLALRTRSDDPKNEGLTLRLWEDLYVNYSQEADERIYRSYERVKGNADFLTPIPEKVRLRIIYECITADEGDGGAEIPEQDHIDDDKHPLVGCFPLHDTEELKWFNENWIQKCHCLKFHWAPIHRLRDYFGEPVAYYFAFLQMYMKWLISPMLVGFFFFTLQVVGDQNPETLQHDTLVFDVSYGAFNVVVGMGLFIIFWSSAFVDFWSRHQATLRQQWGMTNYSEKAVSRPQFKGEWKPDDITGMYREQFDFMKRLLRTILMFCVLVLLMCASTASVIGILLLKDLNPNAPMVKIGLGVACSLVIMVYNVIYEKLSFCGNDYENHRTEQDYENMLIIKGFMFKFINSFSSLIYLSFIRPYVRGILFYIKQYNHVCVGSDIAMNNFLQDKAARAFNSTGRPKIEQNDLDFTGDNCRFDAEQQSDPTFYAKAGGDKVCRKYIEEEWWNIARYGWYTTSTPTGYDIDDFVTDRGYDSVNYPEYFQIGNTPCSQNFSLANSGDEDNPNIKNIRFNFFNISIVDGVKSIVCPAICPHDIVIRQWNEAVLNEVFFQLTSLFVTAIVVQNSLEVGIPIIKDKLASRKNSKKVAAQRAQSKIDLELNSDAKETVIEIESQTEREQRLECYENTIDDMTELIVQFGYVTLFVMAFPLTPFLAFLNNIFEMKVDAINIVRSCQRPHPIGADGVGSWNLVLSVFSVLSVATNVLMVTFRTGTPVVFIKSTSGQWLFFSMFSLALMAIVALEKTIIPDVPTEVTNAIARQNQVDFILVKSGNVDPFEEETPGDGDEDDDGVFDFDPDHAYSNAKEFQLIPEDDVRHYIS